MAKLSIRWFVGKLCYLRGEERNLQRKKEGVSERQELLEGLDRTKVLIDQAYSCFNRTDDPDLIESYVFEINALQSRYSYLLRRVRELDTAQPPALPAQV